MNTRVTGRTPAKTAPRARGEAVEAAACRYLEAQGLHCIERNFTARCGELDLVMREGPVLVFVEVRYRRSDRYGTPAETITARKRERLWRTAQLYLLARPQWARASCRFDVVAARPGESGLQFEWIRDALGA